MTTIDHVTLRRANFYVDLFGRETTNANEAAIAAKKFASILSKNGFKPSDLLISANMVAHLRASFAKQFQEIAARLKAAEAECALLRSKLTAAEARVHEPAVDSHRRSSSTSIESKHPRAGKRSANYKAPQMQAEKFAHTAISAAKRTHWRSSFAAAAGISLAHLKKILASDIIPQIYWDLLDKMNFEDWAPASRQRWTNYDRATLRRLAKGGIDDVELARILTTQLERRILEGGVARQRRNLGIRACRTKR